MDLTATCNSRQHLIHKKLNQTLRQNDYLESGWYIEVEMVSSKLPIPILSIDLW